MMRIPSSQPVRSTVGETATTVKCEATSCTSTGVVTFLLGGAVGAFLGIQFGSMLMEYKPKGKR